MTPEFIGPLMDGSVSSTRSLVQVFPMFIVVQIIENVPEKNQAHVCCGATKQRQMKFINNYQLWQHMSGCCKPPTICGYTFVNPTLWTNPVNPAGDLDCNQWSNDQTQLCYNCNSCKAGLLGNFKERKANIILIVEVVVLIWVYIIACSAFKNAQTEDLFFNRYKQGWT
ncbi:tetraspanin-2 [Gossypium hirsutum]|uniref:Tetraspanin-2 n=1 Tax=Gossypium hirsutum TaxID=3635 RepID=A0ABM3BW80_GOSHI|nr:tetraspanin-2-like [Gossypium hirsutum]